MKNKANVLKVALLTSMIWEGLSCTTNLKSQFYGEPVGNHGDSSNGSFWQFNLKKIDKGY